MPPKIQITKEMVLETAFSLVRKGGLDIISTRNVAKSLKSSTQPIYSYFRNISLLKDAVIKKASEYVLKKYMIPDNTTQMQWE